MKKLLLLLGIAVLTGAIPSALGSHTPAPSSVTIAGSLQSELGCPGDWDPGCAATHLSYDAGDDAWQASFSVPAGNWEYKAALNGSWDENYGAGAAPNGPNIGLSLDSGRTVKFYYDHESHWITDNVNSVIVTAPGSFQSELGCPTDWDPSCLRSWLQDPDGDGVYEFTVTLPAGAYEVKAAIGESWDENYGAGGVPNGPNIQFSVPANTAVHFSYDAVSHVLSITDHVEWDGVRHDSRDPLYRTPGGAAPAGTPVTLRLRTFHDDVTRVRARVWDVNANEQRFVDMHRAASDVSCYQTGLGSRTCDFWEATVANPSPNNLWYRFVVTDGTDTDYYGDDTAALDGGLGAMEDNEVDRSWALTVYDPSFTAPAWARDAFVYQIFPDRFRNGVTENDPQTGDVRYDDPVLALPWSTLPEGYCRNYSDAETNCPWRFDSSPPSWSPTIEGPRGRDYYGGDLKGLLSKLDYLADLGVTAIYLNPVFDAGSNHGYDTQDYTRIDPYFGSPGHWNQLRRDAKRLGIRLILDGVFNHMSSDSPLFDRYHHYDTVGACESLASPWRGWFVFYNYTVPCGAGDYKGWFDFDSIPVIEKSRADVQSYFLTAPDSIAKRWLQDGASGWRLDVMGDASFPNGYWEAFRGAVKQTDPNALIVGELWQKDSTLLRHLRGDRADTAMNYRLRDAVLGLLSPSTYDSKGFGDSGRELSPSEFASRVSSIREDYPDAAYFSLMNLLDSHDTERILWTLTPGGETRAEKELDAGNVADGKRRLRIASLIQFTMPGAPTVFYGDEVGLTGDDDPDDRRTYPWADLGRSPDTQLRAHYKTLASLRRATDALTEGDFRVLAAGDAGGTVVYGRKTGTQAAIVAVNRSGSTRALDLPLAGWVPAATPFTAAYSVGGATATSLPPLSAVLLVATGVDLTPPDAPAGLAATGQRRAGGRHVVHGHGRREWSPLLLRRPGARRGRQRERRLQRGLGSATLHDRLGEHPVAAVDDAYDQRGRPDGHGLRAGLDRRRDEPARPDSEPARPARLRPGRERGLHLDVGGRRVQRRRRQQRRVPGEHAPRGDGHVLVRVPVHDLGRARLVLRRPLRAVRRRLAVEPRCPDGGSERRLDGARGADGAPRRLGLAGGDRAGLGRGRRRPDPLRLRDPAGRRADRPRDGHELRGHGRLRRPDVCVRRPLGRPVVQPLGSLGRGVRDRSAAAGQRHVHGDRARLDRRHRPHRLHRGLARPARPSRSRVEPGRRLPDPPGRDPLGGDADRSRRHAARVQVHARRLGARREGRRVRRDRQPAADALVRAGRSPVRLGPRRELAQRGAVR